MEAAGLEPVLDAIRGWSGAVRRYAQDPEIAAAALRGAADLLAGRLPPPPVPPPGSRVEVLAGLRRARRQALVTAALAETASWDPTVVFPWVTACAEAWIEAGFRRALADQAAAFAVPPEAILGSCPGTVLGLGKLGARELNPSSDVDLIVVYASDAPTGWSLPVGPNELWSRVAREAASLLSEITGDGFCLRVDFDLRPEGRSGALANSAEAIEAYYESHGTPLDRMAWTRARVVAGDPTLGARVLATLRPFLYPRSLAGGALPALAHTLGRLRGSRMHARGAFDLKTGRGGIRDVELVVAAHQLLHGGRLPPLREVRTLSVLEALAAHGLVSTDDAAALAGAYRFLRHLEHVLQYRDDRQTQAMPLAGAALDEVARGTSLPAAALLARLERERTVVARVADRLFGLGEAGRGPAAEAVPVVLDRSADLLEREAAARRLGFHDPDAALAHVDRMRASPRGPLNPRHGERFEGLDAALVRAAAGTHSPDAALDLLARLARSPGHVPLFDVGMADASVLPALARVGAASTVAGAALARDGGAALEHALTGFQGAIPEAGDLAREAAIRADAGPAEEIGERMAAFKAGVELGVWLADLAGTADERAAGRALADLADACVGWALSAAVGEATEGLAVLALGRLGAREMGYRSDLDLVFLRRDGQEVRPAVVQRVLSLLTTRGVAGPMYELDLRLRPSGSQGPLLVDESTLRRFYFEEAGGAERLGALNLRRVAGDAGLGDPIVEEVRAAAVASLRDPQRDREVSEVRFKQHAGVAEGGKSLYDPKMDAGGMLDLETESRLQAVFVVAGPQEIPTGTLALLSRLTQHDGPVRHDFAALERAYRFLVRLTNRAHLVLDRPVSRVPSEGPAADRLARTLGFEGDAPARLLWEAYRGVLAEGARVCARLAEARRGSMSRG